MRNITRLSAIAALACVPISSCSDDAALIRPLDANGLAAGTGHPAGAGGTAGGSGAAGAVGSGAGGEPAGASGAAGSVASGGAATTAGSGGAEASGGAGPECSDGQTACGSVCANTATDQAHCGACYRACSSTNLSSSQCATGLCNPTCSSGFGDCNLDDGTSPDDGCETDLNQNDTCGTSCQDMLACDADEFCVAGACASTCTDPNTLCGGACVALATSRDHCSACDRACSTAGVVIRTCSAGRCQPVCNSGFRDCNPDDGGSGADDGCETDLNSTASCGTSCADQVACAAGENCEQGQCTGDCNLTTCGDACVDTASSALHCGACDRACADTNTTELVCAVDLCVPACASGYADCNLDDGGGADDGCETDLNSTTTCGIDCGTLAACEGTETCESGVCTPTCSLTPCGSECIDTSSSAANCSACDRPCSNAHSSAVVCSSGACAPTCTAGFGDCNVDTGSGIDDGCETDFNAQATCGSGCLSNSRCSDGESCVSGVCTADCAFVACGTACTDTDTSVEHCGACDRACADGAPVTGTSCVAGLCSPTCEANFADCTRPSGASADDGCETALDTDASCGTQCSDVTPCGAGEHCSAGACVPEG